MAIATLSGYLAATAAITWASGQALDALADDEWTDLSDEVDNATDKHMLADVEIVLASAAFAGTGSGIEVYLIPSVDDTNYPNWTGDTTTDEYENNQYFVGFCSTSGATEANRMVLRGVSLPNGRYRWAFRSRAGVALAASGNSASWRPHGFEST